MKINTVLSEIRDLSFADAFKAVMKAYGFSNYRLSIAALIPPETISRYRNAQLRPTKVTLVQLCIGMSLPYDVSIDLLNKAGINILTAYSDDVVYATLLEQSRVVNIYDCNAIISSVNEQKSFGERDIKLFRDSK